MSRIKEKFNELKMKKEKALVSYIMTGYPSENATLSAVRGLVRGGVDIIELGFPFSDPIADGPTIQKASTGSLNNGIKIAKFFKLVKKIRSETNIPLILMTYTNILYNQGYQKFIKNAKNAGIMPSVLVSVKNALITSSSVIALYFTRFSSLRNECSGPTPG